MAYRANSDVALPRPQTDEGWSRDYVALGNAVVFPPDRSGMVQSCGVQSADGSYCAMGSTWRGARQLTCAPDESAKAVEKLAGRHLFAGQIWSHFGHFLTESLSRLWVLDHLSEPPESIIFIPKRPQRIQRLRGYHKEFMELLGIDIPLRIVEKPTEVEELIVPGQGFGLGEIAAGTPEFRAFIHDRFAAGIAPDGPEGLYVSRSALGGREGGALLETAMDVSLRRGGLETLHPQKMSLRDQIARYRAAKTIVGLDGSAFHLFGFVGRPDQRVGMILRRSSSVYRSIDRQLRSFCGIEPVVIQAVAADWVQKDKDRPNRKSFGELDFPYLAQALHDQGLGPEPAEWDIPRFRDMKAAMRVFSNEKGIEFVRRKQPRRRVIGGDLEARP